MLHNAPDMAREEFESRTGWRFKPEGACKGDVCIPIPSSTGPIGDTLNLEAIANSMGMPLVAAPEHNLWALGPASIGARALTQATAPPLVLPDVSGKAFDLSSLRGKKVVVYAWAPY